MEPPIKDTPKLASTHFNLSLYRDKMSDYNVSIIQRFHCVYNYTTLGKIISSFLTFFQCDLFFLRFSFQPTSPPTSPTTSLPLSLGAIIGIVSGGVCFFLTCLFCCWYHCCRASSHYTYTTGEATEFKITTQYWVQGSAQYRVSNRRDSISNLSRVSSFSRSILSRVRSSLRGRGRGREVGEGATFENQATQPKYFS